MSNRIVHFLVMVLTLCSMGALGINVEEVQKAIAEKGEAWKAGDTSVVHLSPAQQRLLGGALPEPVSVLARKAAPQKSIPSFPLNRAIPSSWDWRSKDGKNWVSPIRNQAPYGTCVAFSTIACLESILKIQSGDPSLDVDLSERFLFAYGGGKSSLGWWPSQAADFLMTVGVVPESDCPYSEWDGTSPANPPTQYVHDNDTHLVENWDVVSEFYAGDYETLMKTAILDAPIMAWMEYYEDFGTYTSGVYSHTTGGDMGSHLVAVIGWDDAQDCWICKNSWGTGWGEGGYFRIKKSTNGACSFGYYAYRLYPRTSNPMVYRNSPDVPKSIPDGTSSVTSFMGETRGFTMPTDITLGLFIYHTRQQDLGVWLQNHAGQSVLAIDKKGGTYDHFEGIYLNDKSSWSLSELISYRQQSGSDMESYRGCARPDNNISDLVSAPYGDWTLRISDDTVDETGSLSWWNLYLWAQTATMADPANWTQY